MRIFVIILSILFLAFGLEAAPADEAPVSYQGRIRPAEAYARLWLEELYHAPALKRADWPSFDVSSGLALDLVWKIHLLGHQPFDQSLLFWVQSASLKQAAGLDLARNRFSFNELKNIFSIDLQSSSFTDREKKQLEGELATLSRQLQLFSKNSGVQLPLEKRYLQLLLELQAEGRAPKEIARMLERQAPLIERLKEAGTLLKMLPGKSFSGEWYSLHALKVHVYDPLTNTAILVGNFTLFNDQDFAAIRNSYGAWEEKRLAGVDDPLLFETFNERLLHAYQQIAGTVQLEAQAKARYYPSTQQLAAEAFYSRAPLIEIVIAAYCISLLVILLGGASVSPWVLVFLAGAFVLHTIVLGLRCYILERPPVSNMFETAIYVPWVAVLVGFVFWRSKMVLMASALGAILLLLILKLTGLSGSLENVQAVLDSQFWLMIHVLMVVGSYGVFVVAGVLGHFYLMRFLLASQNAAGMHALATSILRALYVGTILLVTGTILGGVWAAESWGRFWDWDPKESWAFISSCVYLIWIHAYRFNKIGDLGLAVGAVVGLAAISFTWYGVNYILGTGLHSYGFGSGGEGFYALYMIIEALFLVAVGIVHLRRHRRLADDNHI